MPLGLHWGDQVPSVPASGGMPSVEQLVPAEWLSTAVYRSCTVISTLAANVVCLWGGSCLYVCCCLVCMFVVVGLVCMFVVVGLVCLLL